MSNYSDPYITWGFKRVPSNDASGPLGFRDLGVDGQGLQESQNPKP